MRRSEKARLGWSRSRVEIPDGSVVLDVGCGAFPNDAATISCDMSLDEDRHRTGQATRVDRPFVLCDASALPFRDGSIDFVIASHIAEHVDAPEAFCTELARVARSGYIETPSPVAEYVLEEQYHQWRVGSRRSRVRFARKPRKSERAARVTERVYRLYYAGVDRVAPTAALPAGPLGRALDKVLFVVRGSLNRSGIMHTRVRFGPGRELRCEVSDAV